MDRAPADPRQKARLGRHRTVARQRGAAPDAGPPACATTPLTHTYLAGTMGDEQDVKPDVSQLNIKVAALLNCHRPLPCACAE